MWNRREWLQAVAGAGLLPALARPDLAAGQPAAPPSRPNLLAEIGRRTEAELRKRRLVVDYYRIGRKIAYPLPVPKLLAPDIPAEGMANYPWSTWLLWTLEERIQALGWAGQYLGHAAAREAAARDLAALASWPDYGRFTLSTAHAARILATALARWPWIESPLADRLRQAARRLVDSALGDVQKLWGDVRKKTDVLNRPNTQRRLHNIPLITLAGAALAARASGHPAVGQLDMQLHALFGALLDLRSEGFSEGVAYDGYVLDFIADWLCRVPSAERRELVEHPRFEDYLDQSAMLSAPGAVEAVAELGDVEPRQMPFHLSAQAKLLHVQPRPQRSWLVGRVPLPTLRADGLAAIQSLGQWPAGAPPAAGALDAHYALVLRSGWDADDLAVAVSCSRSPMGHLHLDAGSLVIGTQGHWLITDPGYQQYAKGDQRQFTIGPTAHNAPVINGVAQTQKQARRIALESRAPDVWHLAIDLAACYPAAAGVKSLVRHVWLAQKELVVVADRLAGASALRLQYHWHGHPSAAWWIDSGRALIDVEGTPLWLWCPQKPIAGADLNRLPGSAGQLTLSSSIEAAPPVVWWIFAIGSDPPPVVISPEGGELQVGPHRFQV